MSQTVGLVLITALTVATAFAIGYLADIGYLDKAAEIRQAQSNTREAREALGRLANSEEAQQEVNPQRTR